MQYVVISEIDDSKWEDQTGVSYHYPSKYKNVLLPGTKVIYYKGKLKDKRFKDVRYSDKAYYFGIATVGEVIDDPEHPRQYFCTIVDYVPFDKPVLSKKPDSTYFEEVIHPQNHWRDGVRKISETVYMNILTAASMEYTHIDDNVEEKVRVNPNALKPGNVIVTTGLTKKVKSTKNNSVRFTKRAKEIGDAAEKVVFEYLKNSGKSEVDWLAERNETPGYDISYVENGVVHCVEVKGTTLNNISSFILTNNEMLAAQEHGDNYYLYFVANCLSESPKLEIVQNPYAKFMQDEWNKTPLSYNVTFND